MKRLLFGLAMSMLVTAAGTAQTPPGTIPPPYQAPPAAPTYAPGAQGYLPPTPAPTYAPPVAAPNYPAQPAPVIHYHVYNGAMPQGMPSAPAAGCKDCGGTFGSGHAAMSHSSAGRWSALRDPFRACKERCEEWKAAHNAKSCSAGKTLNDMGCHDCRLDCVFIFGSCNDFFQEPCRRGATTGDAIRP